MKYPTLIEVSQADRIQICRWWRFLKFPMTDDEVLIKNAIARKFEEFGGFTPEISKQIDW